MISDSLRAVADSFVLKIILLIVITSLILTSINSYLINGNFNYAVKVNGQKISDSQFRKAFDNEYNRIQQQLGDQYLEFASDQQHIKNIYHQILYRFIDEILLSQYVRRLGLNISDEQIEAVIFSTQAFQFNGQFDNAHYNYMINQMGISADQYVQELRSQMKIQQLINAIMGTDFILKKEADELVALFTQQRSVRKATINVQDLVAKQHIKDEEINNYYELNKRFFTVPEQFRVNYIKLKTAMIRETVPDVEIRSYYDEHQEQFIQPQCNHYSLIQTKTESDAKIVLDKLNKGEDFAAVAKEKSTDIFSAKNGGDIGWLNYNSIPIILKNAGLKNKGQISNIIESSVGYLVIRLDDIKPAKTKSLFEVKNEITKKIKQEKILNTFYKVKNKISNVISNGNEPLVELERVTGMKAVDTGWFSRDCLPKELNFKPLTNAIFNNNLTYKNNILDNNLDIITIDDCVFILHITAYKPENIKSLEEVKDQIIFQIKYNKAFQQARLFAEKILVDLKSGKGDKALKSKGLSFSASKILSRIDQDPIIHKIFSLTLPEKNKTSYGIVDDTQGNIVLLALDEVKISKISEIQKKNLIKSIIQNNAQITFEALMNSLRKKAQIEISDTLKQHLII